VIVAVAYAVSRKARGNPDLGGARSENFLSWFLSDAPGKNRASGFVAQPIDSQRPATDEGELAMCTRRYPMTIECMSKGNF
jgi:hypothetical protein